MLNRNKFRDGFELFFEKCRNEWAIEKMKRSESYCVAERDISAPIPYFIFYSKDRVKVVFDKKGIFCKKRNKAEFQNLQVILNSFGLSSYDMT